MYFVISLLLIIPLVITTLIGVVCIIYNKGILEIKLMTAALFCFSEGVLFEFLLDFAQKTLITGFNVSHLAYFGCFLFMFAGNLITERKEKDFNSKTFKLRIIPIISVIVVIGLIIALTIPYPDQALLTVITSAPLLPLAYFCTRQLLFPADSSAITPFTRKFIAFEAAFYLLIILKLEFYLYDITVVSLIFGIAIVLLLAALSVLFISETFKKADANGKAGVIEQ